MTRLEQVAKMRAGGCSYVDIQNALGISHGEVGRLTRQAKDAGLLPEHRAYETAQLRVWRAKTVYQIKMGHTRDVVAAITPEQFDWLVGVTARTECKSVAEYLTELVRDAYEEDKQEEK